MAVHEQTRSSRRSSRHSTKGRPLLEDLSRRALDALFPSASRWWAWARGSAAAALGVTLKRRASEPNKLAREAITDALMVLACPDGC